MYALQNQMYTVHLFLAQNLMYSVHLVLAVFFFAPLAAQLAMFCVVQEWRRLRRAVTDRVPDGEIHVDTPDQMWAIVLAYAGFERFSSFYQYEYAQYRWTLNWGTESWTKRKRALVYILECTGT